MFVPSEPPLVNSTFATVIAAVYALAVLTMNALFWADIAAIVFILSTEWNLEQEHGCVPRLRTWLLLLVVGLLCPAGSVIREVACQLPITARSVLVHALGSLRVLPLLRPVSYNATGAEMLASTRRWAVTIISAWMLVLIAAMPTVFAAVGVHFARHTAVADSSLAMIVHAHAAVILLLTGLASVTTVSTYFATARTV